jgi:hypothetical protein
MAAANEGPEKAEGWHHQRQCLFSFIFLGKPLVLSVAALSFSDIALLVPSNERDTGKHSNMQQRLLAPNQRDGWD